LLDGIPYRELRSFHDVSRRAVRMRAAAALLLLSPVLVGAFMPTVPSAVSCQGNRWRDTLALRAETKPPGLGNAPLPALTPALTLFYVDPRDVPPLQKLLAESGGRNVDRGPNDYGELVTADISTDLVVRRAADFAPLVRPSGRITLEGIRAEEVEGVKKALAPFFEDLKSARDDSGLAIITGWRIDPWMVPGFSSLPLAQERERTKTNSKFWKWRDDSKYWTWADDESLDE
jgi:hypothetical protein